MVSFKDSTEKLVNKVERLEQLLSEAHSIRDQEKENSKEKVEISGYNKEKYSVLLFFG